jgi:hypothetical protein
MLIDHQNATVQFGIDSGEHKKRGGKIKCRLSDYAKTFSF